MKNKRTSGILLHITSLPSAYGIGDLGSQAYRFIDFLHDAGQSCWQILPLNPTNIEKGNSPYASSSAFAGNCLLISPELLVLEGFIENKQLGDIKKKIPDPVRDRVDYDAATIFKNHMLELAFKNYSSKAFGYDERFNEFCVNNRYWLDDYAMYAAFLNYFREKKKIASWKDWPGEIRDRRKDALKLLSKKIDNKILKQKFFQYLFFRQWQLLKKYASKRKISIIGDIPIYVDFDSSDVWAHPGIFKLDSEKKPLFVSGTPPDYFSKTGQLWNNPVYDWDALQKKAFAWWIYRIKHNMSMHDLVRLDHFRGFCAYWEVEAGKSSAEQGRWVRSRGSQMFRLLQKQYQELPFIAENLGIITGDVEKLRKKLKLPGTKVLQFAFGDDFPTNEFMPHNYEKSSVVYTGTHDNDTARGWWMKLASALEKKNFKDYTGRKIGPGNINIEMIRIASSSVADMAIFPMQDILGLGTEAKMNRPSTGKGNWQWKLIPGAITKEHKGFLLEMTYTYGRLRS